MELRNFKNQLLKSLFLIGLFLLSLPSLANDEKNVVVLLYPSKSTPYDEIIAGISTNTAQFNKKGFLISDNNNEIKQWIVANSPFAVIAIGNDAFQLAHSITTKIPIISAGILLTNDNYDKTGVSLSLKEDSLKKKIHTYFPNLIKVHITDNGKNMIFFSDSIHAPRFKQKKITNINKTVKHLWKLINSVDPKTEAVWIDSSIDPDFAYQLAERAWERNVVLLSHNATHLDRGVVMVFFPDFRGMGERIGQLLAELHNGRLEPLTAINMGINLRTAKHLGVSSFISKKEFKVILK